MGACPSSPPRPLLCGGPLVPSLLGLQSHGPWGRGRATWPSAPGRRPAKARQARAGGALSGSPQAEGKGSRPSPEARQVLAASGAGARPGPELSDAGPAPASSRQPPCARPPCFLGPLSHAPGGYGRLGTGARPRVSRHSRAYSSDTGVTSRLQTQRWCCWGAQTADS